MTGSPMYASCHCGNIRITAPRLPDHVNEDMCTICRRYGAVWAYYPTDEVKFDNKPDAVVKQYIWGDKEISFNFCDNCGCMCYWWPVARKPDENGKMKMAINTRMVDPEVLKYVERRIQYDALVAPLQDPKTAHPEDVYKYE